MFLCFRLLSEFYPFLLWSKENPKADKWKIFRLLSEFYPFLCSAITLFTFSTACFSVSSRSSILFYFPEFPHVKFPPLHQFSVSSRSSILFYLMQNPLFKKLIQRFSVSSRSSILFYPLTIKPLFYDILFGYFRENYLNFQFSFLKEQKICSNSHFYSIVAISI